MRKLLLLFLMIFFCFEIIKAQELNAVVSVNGSKIEGNKSVFKTLENQIRSLVNDRKWSEESFLANEKIDCSFTLIINEMPTETSFRGELLVNSRRPVYHATYTTPMLNFRDTNLSFDYVEYQPLEFNSVRIDNNLTATIAFYVYLILGLDFDSMSPLGGTTYFNQMQTIVANVQSFGWGGWEAFGNERNKQAISLAFNDPAFEAFRLMWYDYHRLGLDEMASNIEMGRKNVVSSLPVISSLYSQRRGAVLLTLFGDSKLDELVNILAKERDQEKRQAYETLRNLFPTRSVQLEKIQK